MRAVRVALRISHPPRQEISTMTTSHLANAPLAVKPATPAILGTVGGALGIIGFFLPWRAYGAGIPQGVEPHTDMYSFWDLTIHYIAGANLPGSTPTGQAADE
jgi:hypothetical protein